MEHRNYTRIPLEVVVELHLDDDTCLYGETGDLSLDGAFINFTTGARLEPGKTGKLVLVINSEEGWVRVRFDATIVHVRNDGIGIRLDSAHSAHYSAFLKLLLEGNNDIDILLDELAHHPGEQFSFSNF